MNFPRSLRPLRLIKSLTASFSTLRNEPKMKTENAVRSFPPACAFLLFASNRIIMIADKYYFGQMVFHKLHKNFFKAYNYCVPVPDYFILKLIQFINLCCKSTIKSIFKDIRQITLKKINIIWNFALLKDNSVKNSFDDCVESIISTQFF